MTRLELAKLRFKQLAPRLTLGADVATSDLLEAWLRNEVVPVVEDLFDRPLYRRRVLEVPAQLFTAPPGDRRVRVTSCAEALVSDAQTQVAVAGQFKLVGLLADHDRDQDLSWIAEQASVDTRTAVEKLAERPWFDLVKPQDFWAPSFDLYLRRSDPLLTRQFRRGHSPAELLGDHVIERMFARIEFWRRRLECTRERLQQGLGTAPDAYAAHERMFCGASDVAQKCHALAQDWRAGGEARLRNACLVLLQTYAAYHHLPQVPWLGRDPQEVAVQGHCLRSYFRHQGTVLIAEQHTDGRLHQVGSQQASLVDVQLVRRVAAALEDVTALYERGIHPDDLIAEAKDQFRLVVVVQPRMVLWQGTLLELPWNGAEKTWNLLLHLAVKGEGKLPLRDFALTGIESSRDLSIRKFNLVKFLSQTAAGEELAVLVERPRGGDCRLQLEASQIKVLDLDADRWTVDEREFLPTNR